MRSVRPFWVLACGCASLVVAPAVASSGASAQTVLRGAYDRAEDVSFVTGPLLGAVRRNGMTVEASLRAAWRGTTPPSRLDEVTLEFLASTSASGRLAGWSFRDSHDLTLLIDGTQRRTYPGAYTGSIRGRVLMETVSFWVPVADVARIASARTVEGRLGSWAFTLSPGEIGWAREMALYLAHDPAAPVPTPEAR
jgi:hypothetical protein